MSFHGTIRQKASQVDVSYERVLIFDLSTFVRNVPSLISLVVDGQRHITLSVSHVLSCRRMAFAQKEGRIGPRTAFTTISNAVREAQVHHPELMRIVSARVHHVTCTAARHKRGAERMLDTFVPAACALLCEYLKYSSQRDVGQLSSRLLARAKILYFPCQRTS